MTCTNFLYFGWHNTYFLTFVTIEVIMLMTSGQYNESTNYGTGHGKRCNLTKGVQNTTAVTTYKS